MRIATATLLLTTTLLCVLSSPPTRAQTTHTVTVQNFTFAPANLTIDAGDTVVWENVQGFHNVNGSTATYPDNPEGFTSGVPASAPWQFSFTFTIPGAYGYRCDPHFAGGMVGTVTVNSPTSVEDDLPVGMVLSGPSPNPFRGETGFTLTTATPEPVRVAVYDVLGREVVVLHDGPMPAGQPVTFVWAPTAARTGVYFLRVEEATYRAVRKVVSVH